MATTRRHYGTGQCRVTPASSAGRSKSPRSEPRRAFVVSATRGPGSPPSSPADIGASAPSADRESLTSRRRCAALSAASRRRQWSESSCEQHGGRRCLRGITPATATRVPQRMRMHRATKSFCRNLLCRMQNAQHFFGLPVEPPRAANSFQPAHGIPAHVQSKVSC